MARSLNGSSDYLRKTSWSAATNLPITLSVWFYPTNLTPAWRLFDISTGSDIAYLIGLHKRSALNVLRAQHYDGGADTKAVESAADINANAWNHGGAIFTSATARYVWLNGVETGPEASSAGFVGVDEVYLGAAPWNVGGENFPGYVAEAAIWTAALSSDEMVALSKGLSPLSVRPQSLVAYWPLWGRATDEEDWVGGNHLTVSGATAVEHPRVIYPTSRSRVYFGAASSDTTVSPTVGSIVVAGSAPTVKQNILRQPTVGSVVVTGNAPTLKTNTIRQPSTGSVIVSGNAPAVVTGGNHVVNPNTGTIVVSGLVPTLKVNTIRQPTVGSVVVAGAAPTVRQGIVRLPTVGSIVVAGLAPTVSYTSHVVRTPSSGTITVAGNAPEIIGASIWTNVSAASTIWTNATAATTSWTNQ